MQMELTRQQQDVTKAGLYEGSGEYGIDLIRRSIFGLVRLLPW